MTRPVIALFGDFSGEREVIDRAVKEFGWATAAARTDGELAELWDRSRVLAVLCHAQDCCGGAGCLPEFCAHSQGSRVRSIVCWRAAEHLDDCDFRRLGAYDALLMPLRFSEVRLTLGFLAQAFTQEAGHTARDFGHADCS